MRPRHRLALCFAAGLGAHLLAALVMPMARGRGAPVSPGAAAAPEIEVAIDEPASPPASSPASSPASGASERRAGAAPRAPGMAARSASPSSPATADDGVAPGPAASALPGVADLALLAPRAPVDLGVGNYWKAVAPEPSERPAAPSVVSMMREELDARDRDLGLGMSGPLVTAAHAAASLAPDVGVATLEIDADETGRVTGARVVATAADAAAWDAVARDLVIQMASKRVRVRRGARGARVRLRIAAERVLPSGEKVTTSSGAVPDDVPGADKVCEGTGPTRRCTAGLPAGATVNGWDVANFGARASRMVRVAVLGETAL